MRACRVLAGTVVTLEMGWMAWLALQVRMARLPRVMAAMGAPAQMVVMAGMPALAVVGQLPARLVSQVWPGREVMVAQVELGSTLPPY